MAKRCVRGLGKEGKYQVAIGGLEKDKEERKGMYRVGIGGWE